jgi:RNA polymerase sigma factor (sigma-70 family)
VDEQHRDLRTLLEEIRAGSEEAACEFLASYGQAVIRVVRRHLDDRLRSQFDSMDLEQDVWASFFADPPDPAKMDRPEALVAFLVTMARNKTIDAARAHLNCQKRDLEREKSLQGSAAREARDLAASDPSPSKRLAAKERWEGLPARERRVLELLCEGQHPKAIAAEVHVAEKTVRRIFSRFLWGDRP